MWGSLLLVFLFVLSQIANSLSLSFTKNFYQNIIIISRRLRANFEMAGVFNAIQSTTDFKTKKVKKETEKNLLIFTCGITWHSGQKQRIPYQKNKQIRKFQNWYQRLEQLTIISFF